MGAMTFEDLARGKSAKLAFSAAVEQAAYEHGHGGYTGTLAEKHQFEIVEPTREIDQSNLESDALALAEEMRKAGYGDDKWGPAMCLVVKEPVIVKEATRAAVVKKLREKWKVPDVSLITTRRKGRVTATATIPPSGGYSITRVLFGEGASAAEAYGDLISEDGLYVFFGWASS